MRALNFGEGIADAGHVLVGVQTGRGTACFESARIEYQRSLAPAPSTEGRDLSDAILEQALVVVAHLGTVYLGRIFKHVGKADKRIAKDHFVRHAGAEDVD